ncbi:thiol reductant ABC exporter subunit CydD [Brachybacterium sp. FME24]|uniref:thiol reductant ABC exporter subunit CydD n=1 Tax=Brachybacterium sp. FME24 TaxID=2742605 RepID=UPI001866E189|nr:thiol reductant ABC exporter subunit CydD [Brachybacterium sp. FME24]
MTATTAGPRPTRRTRRAPLDPRLLREVTAARRHVARTVALGLVQALCVIVTALVIGRLGAQLLVERQLPQDAPALLLALLAALALRAGAVLLEQRTAHRAATDAIGELRGRVVSHAATLGPRGSAGRGADLTTLATTGVENLRPYLVGYVPQLMLSVTVTPLCLLAIGILDPLSALIALVTLPLVPLFMILVGTMTVGRSEQLLTDMRSLWTQLLDLVDGLPTLRALGREKGPEKVVAQLGDRHRASAMGSLKFAFLSSMVLELLATLCVALVAVSIGMRLVYGEMDLAPALAVLVLAPEVYQPLRNVGSQYHASTDGLAAVTASFEVLDEQPAADGTLPAPDLRTATVALRGVAVASRDGLAPHDADLTLHPGRVLALTGPSGSGKTTAVHVLLGLLDPDRGRAEVIDVHGAVTDVRDLQRRSLWDQVALLPQRPVLPPGTIRSVLASARPGAGDADLARVASATGLDLVVAERGWEADLGRAGAGISLGERQRLALARALLSPAPLVVLDEPTAHLDGATERVVLDLIRTLREQGRTVLVIAHRSRLAEVADDIARVEASA